MDEHRRPVLGLKASPLPILDDDDSGDEISFDFDDEEPALTIQSPKAINKTPTMLVLPKIIAQINSFDDASIRINAFLASLNEYIIPSPYKGDLYFIPEHVVTDEFTEALNQYVSGTDEKHLFLLCDDETLEDFHDTFKAQIQIAKYYKDNSTDVSIYANSKLDSRISALIHFLLSKNTDHKISCSHAITAIEEFVKFPAVAPISKLFPDFSIKNLIYKIAVDLATLFPTHPILESVIHNLSHFEPKAIEALTLAKEAEQDEDSDFSDSFFESIQQIRIQPPLELQGLLMENVANPLEGAIPATMVDIVTLPEPPQTITYKLIDGSSQLVPNLFVDWIDQIRPQLTVHTPTFGFPRSPSSGTRMFEGPASGSFNEIPCLSEPSAVLSKSSDKDEEYLEDCSEEYVEQLIIQAIDNPQKVLSFLPAMLQPKLFPSYLPVLHILNETSVAPVKRGTIYPNLLNLEFELHNNLIKNNNEDLERATKETTDLVQKDMEREPIHILSEKRPQHPPPVATDLPPQLVSVLALCDIEFVVHGRSPITCDRSARDPILATYEPLDSNYRVEALFKFYIDHELPPYFAFRIAFAIACNLFESKPEISCSFIFEALNVLLNWNKNLASCSFVRSALLFFGENLDRIDKYYYSALVFDSYFLTNVKDTSASNKIAPIAQKNRDMIRSAFHFSRSLKTLVAQTHCEEALFIAQLISGYYTNQGMHHIALSILTFLLHKSYKISIGRRRDKMNSLSLKTMPPVRQPIATQSDKAFIPVPTAINTLLTGIQLADLLTKLNYFTIAQSLLDTLKSSTDNSVIQRLADFINAKLFLKQNLLEQFFATLPPLQISNKRMTISFRSSNMSQSSSDIFTASMKLIARAYIDRKMYAPAIFWSEMIINSTPLTKIKNVGMGYYLRASAMTSALSQQRLINNKSFSLHVPQLDSTMESIGKYTENRVFDSIAELTAEILSTLRVARIYYDRVACVRKYVEISLLYVDILMQHFFPVVDGERPEPLHLKKPLIETTLTVGQQKNRDYLFEEINITMSNYIEELTNFCSGIETNVAKLMNPITIIYSQIMMSKLYRIKNQIDDAKIQFNFAFSNLCKYFACGGSLIPRDLPLQYINLFYNILQNICHLLLYFDKDYINDRLIAFDLFNDVHALLLNTMRVQANENKVPIVAGIDINVSVLKQLSNAKFPDFIQILQEAGFETNNQSNLDADMTIGSYLTLINANIHLYETQKLKDDEMHNRNRFLCKKIETLAEVNRRDNTSRLPVDTAYSFVARHVPMSSGAVFVQHLFQYIFIYIPTTGQMRFVTLTPAKPTTYTTIAKKKEVSFTTSSNIFSPQFFELITLFLLCDKKQYHNNFNFKTAINHCSEARKALFGDLKIDLGGLNRVPDDHYLGENRFFGKALKGALYTIETAPKPLIFVTSGDLRALPLEMMFPNQMVLRCWNFSQLMLRPNTTIPPPRMTVLRWKAEAEHLMDSAIKRSIEGVNAIIEACGGCFPSIPYVNGKERNIIFPFPLFSSNKETDFYTQEYHFCSFIDVNPTDQYPKIPSGLWVFTYSDFYEMPPMLERLITSNPYSYFMFIPAQFVRDAFKEMKLIFERHARRIGFVNAHFPTDPSLVLHWVIASDPYSFITSLQSTLMHSLGCPIPLIAPTH